MITPLLLWKNKLMPWKTWFILIFLMGLSSVLRAQGDSSSAHPFNNTGALVLLIIVSAIVLFASLYLLIKVNEIFDQYRKGKEAKDSRRFIQYTENLSSNQIDKILNLKRGKKSLEANKNNGASAKLLTAFAFVTALLTGNSAFAQSPRPEGYSVLSETGVIITIVLILTPILVGVVLMIIKVSGMLRRQRNRHNRAEAEQFAVYLRSLSPEDAEAALLKRKEALEYRLSRQELSGSKEASDTRGLLSNINQQENIRFIASKRKAVERPNVDPKLSRLIIWYLVSATVWLIFGTTVGEYLGIKFVAPDIDHTAWLNFGRLRPVHTNAVFWGWSSLGMLGLGYYVVPRVSNVAIASLKAGWWSLWLINATVIFGSLALMAGINNGGGEYREYIWPIQLLFGIALVITLINFLRTIARRTTKEIYVSNWYIVAAVIFGITISVVAYIPYWQQGLGETIIQGYYMHQGVGMWFMMFTLGLVYYFLPQQLNKPIYSYSLGILAFWTQIFFYTLIGTHHFVFSAIPWSLQTVAIVGSVGMVIPVVAGTTNFIMTFNGSWHKLSGSYTLPFFLVGIVFYFTGSMQGTAEAFRSTNLIWHFTDFTVAHSHLTMYGIIAFFLWAGIYAIVPRITRQEPPQVTVGIHFWMAFIGLMFYTIPLMAGSTLRGLMWIDKKPFIDSVTFMAPYWLWRAIGGSLMWAAHLIFAYNMYRMIAPRKTVNINEEAVGALNTEEATELIDIKG